MEEILSGQLYEEDTVEELSVKIMVEVRSKLKALSFPNYKYIIQVMIGEQHGQGMNVLSQCVWDTDCDGSAKFFYSNNSLWCSSIVFAVFHY
uniref:Tctex1 domain-containing protein 1 n=1 Tax=Heterorhabditis bacteriophora TaxID=37862 RepID=A0A1I7WSL8_HETBA